MNEMNNDGITNTVRFALQDAIAETSHFTGIRAGSTVEKLLDALVVAVREPSTAWAFLEAAAGDDTTREAVRYFIMGTEDGRRQLLALVRAASAVIEDVTARARRHDDDGLLVTIQRKASSNRSEDIGHAVAFAAVLLDRREQRARGLVLECGVCRHWVKGSNSDDADDVYDGHCTSPGAPRDLMVRVLASYSQKPPNCPGAEPRT
jgi:hypothetical protein